EMEAEADYFGGVFGRMAGYNTVGIGGEFFKRLYKQIDLPDSLFGYPSLQDRISICNNSLNRFERLVPVFRAANLLTVTNNYDQAAVCFHYLADIFPSREMFNNIGVSKAQEALNYYQAEELKYIYPFGLDRETRLDSSNFYVGNKGEQTTIEKRQVLLESAVELFEKSISLDAEYAPAVINLALAKCLLGEEEMGLALAKKALKLTAEEENLTLKANAYIARSLALIHNEKYTEAEALLEQAIEGNKDFAENNLEVLKHRKEKKYARLLKKKAKTAAKSEIRPAQVNNEYIGEYNLDAISTLAEMVKEGGTEENFVTTTIQKQNEERPRTIIYDYAEDGVLATSIWQSATWMKGVWGTTYLMTPKGYEGKTVRGIQLGNHSEDVRKQYGVPDRLLAASNANYYVYQDATDPDRIGLIFVINNQNEVTQWMIYAKTDHPAAVAGN
ncbi:MAG: hypothetical protein MK212_22355, partial [Saprospiraceae bacterium]|nr:hypothetical protein [Saprospiraceae bacterium]